MTALWPWQVECIKSINAALEQRNFLVVATPGSGKTKMSLALARDWFDRRLIYQLVVVVPTRHLKVQWTGAAAQVGLKLGRHLDNDVLIDGLPPDVVGYVCTYAQVAAWPEVHAALTKQRATLVLFDEIHHGADNRTWGQALKAAFDEFPMFCLALSGTPFRSDGAQIPFLKYGENNVVIPGYTYSYANALDDQKCRSIVFAALDGDMRWTCDVEHHATFSDKLAERQSRHRLLTALRGEAYQIALLKAANDRLATCRQTHPDAGGLVFAIDQSNAIYLGALMERTLAIKPEIAISDDREASKKIAEFRKGVQPWLVAVRMVSEGVDIPRLRVGAYLSNVEQELSLRQMIGRFVRWIDGIEEQTAHFFMPKHPEFVRIEAEILIERNQSLWQTTTQRTAPPGHDEYNTFAPIAAMPLEFESIIDGKRRPFEPVDPRTEALKQIRAKYPPELTIENLMAIYAEWQATMPQLQATIADENDLKKAERVMLNKRVGGLAAGQPEKYKQIHIALADKHGYRNVAHATLDQLRQANATCIEWRAGK